MIVLPLFGSLLKLQLTFLSSWANLFLYVLSGCSCNIQIFRVTECLGSFLHANFCFYFDARFIIQYPHIQRGYIWDLFPLVYSSHSSTAVMFVSCKSLLRNYLHKDFNLSFPPSVLDSSVCILQEELWDWYVCVTHKILKTYFLRWYHSIVLHVSLNYTLHWILTTSGHLMYDEENIQWKSSLYK